MGLYSLKTDQELLDLIAKYEAAIETATIGGDVAVIAGEGRRMEFTSCNIGGAWKILRELVAELARRPGYDHLRHYAIPVEIGP